MEEGGAVGEGRRLAAGWQGLICVLLSAALYALSFPPFEAPEAAWVFAVPLLLWGLFGSPARREGLLLAGGGWLAWLVLIIWLRNCTRVLEMPGAGALGWLITLALALVLGLFWAGWAWAALWCVRAVRRPGPGRIVVMLALPALWVVMEWIRGWLFTGFPWLPLAASQWQRPLLLQVAALTGSAGIAYVLLVFNVGISFYLQRLWVSRRERWLKRLSPEFYLAVALVALAIGYGLHGAGPGGPASRARQQGPVLAFVQPNVDVALKWDPDHVRENLDTLADLTRYAAYLGGELVLWPEAPTPMPVKGNDSMQAWVADLSRETGRPMLIGNVAREQQPDAAGRSWYNAVFSVSPAGGVDTARYYAKRRLVPFGEYVPLAGWLPFVRKLVPVDADFGRGGQAVTLTPDVRDWSAGRAGVLLCYEDIFPALARANVLAGADWHYVATNNVWFGEEAAAIQHAAHSVLRAVETRRPVVRCGNAGWSGWIDEYGHIRHVMLDDNGSIYFQGVDTAAFSRSTWWSGRLSPYVRYGDWFTALCAALATAGALLIARWRRYGQD